MSVYQVSELWLSVISMRAASLRPSLLPGVEWHQWVTLNGGGLAASVDLEEDWEDT